jgi:hypothetical protein
VFAGRGVLIELGGAILKVLLPARVMSMNPVTGRVPTPAQS